MNNIKLKLAASLLTSLGIVGANAALINQGDQLNVSGTILSGSDTGYVSYNGATAINCYAGAFSLNVLNTTTPHAAFTIQTFCTDVGVEWKNSDTYTAKDFAGQTGINPHWAGQASIQDVAYLYNNFFVGQTLTLNQDAGMQLAIWKLLYDSNGTDGTVSSSVKGFGSGKLQAWGFGTDAMNWAATYVADIITARAGNSFPTYSGLWLSPNDGNSQGLIWTPDTPTGNGGSVPEAATLYAGALLLVPLGVSFSRVLRRRQARSMQ